MSEEEATRENGHAGPVVAKESKRSASDGDADGEKKKKRIRRRRGRGRFRPYEFEFDPQEPSTSEGGVKKRIRNRVPMAPSNTTQFLLDDMERRAEEEREHEIAHCAEERRRVRSISVSSELLVGSDGSDEQDSLSDAEHREFENELEEFNLERISHLSKDEMAREILEKDKTADLFQENLIRMNRENERLKRLLEINGIPIHEKADASVAKSPIRAQPVV